MKIEGFLVAADVTERKVTLLADNGVNGITLGARCTVIIHDETLPTMPDPNERQPGE